MAELRSENGVPGVKVVRRFWHGHALMNAPGAFASASP
jgi:hypothetical protein